MEGVLHTTLSENIQDETKKQSFKPEGAEESESVLSSTNISQVEAKNSALTAKEETNEGMNGQVHTNSECLDICDPPSGSESLQQKTYSPTLIESAFKVMKNLFSPDKTKSKSANIISPVKQHQSASGSPSSSIYITTKTDFTPSESGNIENPLIIQTGENSIKNQLNMNQVGVHYSPLTLESHNNTDESFLTTVSIIDDSFHSAITNLDENGETMNLETNIINNFLNNSQNLGIGDPYNETLEDSEYCLENTTLRNGSFGLEGTTMADVSVLNKDGSGENWSSSQINGIQNGKFLVDPHEIPVSEAQNEITKEGHCYSTVQTKDVLEYAETLKKNYSEDNNPQAVRPEESSDTIMQSKIHQESNNTDKNMNMENIFLNKAFDTPKNNPGSLETLSELNNVCENTSEAVEGENKEVEVNCCYKVKSETSFEGSNDGRDVSLENSISTTTVILNSGDAVDLDQILMTLEDVSNPSPVSPQISSAGSMSTLSENITTKQFSNELEYSQDSKPFSETTPDTETNFSPVHKPQKNKSSISERNASGNASNFNKIKLHKSDELINHRISSESPEGKRTSCKKKSSLDVSLIKSTEASKQSSPGPNSEYKADFGTSELNIPVREDIKSQNLSKLDKDVTPNEPTAVSVISQQSYTVLTTDKSLNRPVIESAKVNEDFAEKHTFQKDALCPTCSPEALTVESFATSNYCNASLGAAHSVTPSHQKQSTPLWKGNGRDSPSDDSRTFAKPTSLNLTSPKESVPDGKREMEHFSISLKPNSLDKTIQMFHSIEDPAEFSPVNPISENELIFSNSIECEMEVNPCFTVSDPKSTRTVSSKEPSEPNQGSGKKSGLMSQGLQEAGSETTKTVCNLNQTFDKKLGSPQPHKLNQTFDKKPRSHASSKSNHFSEDTSGCEKLNVTFDKNVGPPSANISNRTFTKKTESLEIERSNQTFVVSESPECNEMNKTYNKNFVGKEPIQTFDQKSDSPGLQKLNETSAKKSQSTDQTTQLTETRLGSPIPNITNQTFVKEKEVYRNQQKKVQDMNKTFQGTSGSEANDFVRNAELGMQLGEEEKAPEKQTQSDKDLAEDKTVTQNVDQQDSDHIDGCHRDLNGSFVSGRSSNTSLVGSEFSTLLLNEGSLSRNQSIDDLAGKLGKLELNESSGSKQAISELLKASNARLCEDNVMIGAPTEEKNASSKSISPSDDKLRCDSYLVQLIQEQFSSNDIEKICSVVDDLSSMKLSSQILKASELFDKSIHENLSNAESRSPETEIKPDKLVNSLSPKSFDFLNSIQGKPTGRDWSRESLYVKFDPLVQPNPNSLIDFTKEGEALAEAEKSPPIAHDSSVCEQLLNISPQKKPDDIVPPLTPLSHKSRAGRSEDKVVRVKELQNEIYFLKNLYAERERTNKAKMDDYESQVAKLMGESCFLEDKLKEAHEREKALVKKMKAQTQSLSQLKIIMEEYVKVISKLTAELETLKAENQKQVEALSTEKDSYMTHLQNTEAAFTDVHAKYEKSKKTIVSLKTNEAMYRNTIAEQAQKMEDFKTRAREAQEKAVKEFEKIQEELGEAKASHNQETARLRAQLRKTELKVEALQESLEQKIKENQKLTAICDELIEGKK